MTRRIRVVVTQVDIDRGIPEVDTECPIARALRREGYVNAAVGEFGWWPDGMPYTADHRRERRPYLSLSDAAQQFVRTFDRHMTVAPATFYLEGPDA